MLGKAAHRKLDFAMDDFSRRSSENAPNRSRLILGGTIQVKYLFLGAHPEEQVHHANRIRNLERCECSVVMRCLHHWQFFPAELPSSLSTESSLFTEFEENCVDYCMCFSCTLLARRLALFRYRQSSGANTVFSSVQFSFSVLFSSVFW